MSALEKSILATVSYFDVFDYPLTLMETWKWLFFDLEPKTKNYELRTKNYEQIKISKVQEELENNPTLKQKLGTMHGFYFLKGREQIVATRMARYRLADRKFQRAKRIIKILRYIPFVKMIAVCNTLAYNNSRPRADIDLFIITSRKRVWQVRWWVTGFLAVFKLRPRPGQSQDTICPSFFVDEDHLDLKDLAIKNDIYLPYWLTQVFPVYDQGVYKKLVKANNYWITQQIPNWQFSRPSSRRRVSQAGFLKKILTVLSFILPEFVFKRYQMKIMPVRLKQLANQDSRVVVRDYMLKFHDNDRRAFFLEQWQKKLAQVYG